MSQDFGEPANNYNLDKKPPLTILFCPPPVSTHSLSLPLRVSGKPIIIKLTDENLKIWYIFEVQWFKSLLQCASVTDFFNGTLFESPANNMCSKFIFNLFCIPKVILKLHLDGKLQVRLVYYLYYKGDFSSCQTLWLIKC